MHCLETADDRPQVSNKMAGYADKHVLYRNKTGRLE